ncbi:MAG TPA: transporter [Candidatus Acidoferrales bacterium]|nr:transporter [Candidatus Acidoferrales bacterium]
MKDKILLAITVCLLSLTAIVRASEGGTTHYISGSYTDFCGMPPSQPGLYLANYFLDYGNGEVSASKQLPLGGIFGAGVTANSQAEVPMAIYAYPFSLYDITFSSGISVPYLWEDVKVTASYDRNGTQISGAREQSINGLSDIEMFPIMAAWTNGDFTVGGMFNVFAPTGDFDTGQLANPGMGYWTFEPMVAFSWLSSKIGTEFTVFTGVDFNTENTTTDYQSGDVFHVDATLAEHVPLFGGFVGAGASAFYLKQFTGDSGSGARLGSFETESAGVGPTVSYIHKIGKTTLVVDGSWLPQLHTVNTTQGNFFWAKMTLIF